MSLQAALNASNNQNQPADKAAPIFNRYSTLKKEHDDLCDSVVAQVNHNFVNDIKTTFKDYESKVIEDTKRNIKIKLGKGEFYYTFSQQPSSGAFRMITSKKLQMDLGAKHHIYFIEAEPHLISQGKSKSLYSFTDHTYTIQNTDLNKVVPSSFLEQIELETRKIIHNIELLKSYQANYYRVYNERHSALSDGQNEGISLKNIIEHLTSQIGFN